MSAFSDNNMLKDFMCFLCGLLVCFGFFVFEEWRLIVVGVVCAG